MGYHILIVEDDPLLTETLASILANQKYEISTVNNGDKCIDLLKAKNSIDLIILDVALPEQEGIDVLQILSEDKQFRDLPCIIMTKSNQPDVVIQAMQMGAADYLVSPIEAADLIEKVSSLLFKFKLDEDNLRKILSHCLASDNNLLFQSPTLARLAGNRFIPFPVHMDARQFCVLVPTGISPLVLAKQEREEMETRIHVFVTRKSGWFKIWPRKSSEL